MRAKMTQFTLLHTLLLVLYSLTCSALFRPMTMRLRAPLPSLSAFFKQNTYPLTSIHTQQNVQLSSLLPDRDEKGSVVLFLTHFADLSSFELAQETLYYLPQLQQNKIRLSAIGPGSVANAEEFSKLTNFPKECLYIDQTAGLYKELEFNKGPLPSQPISPYVKLGAMLMGIGSPGTISEVIRGYAGDRSASSNWIKQSLRLVKQEKFDVLGKFRVAPYTIHHHTPYTTHHTPYTIHHIPYTIHHIPYTIHHIPYTIHHTSYTIYHIPYTIYHIPYTIYH
ncbi:hypothetical protein EON63_12110, partial [archaeon]